MTRLEKYLLYAFCSAIIVLTWYMLTLIREGVNDNSYRLEKLENSHDPYDQKRS